VVTVADVLTMEFLGDLRGIFESNVLEKGERQSAGDTGCNLTIFFVRKI